MLLQHYKPKPLIIADCFAFHKRDQQPKEKVNEFLTELRKLARSCDFGDFLEQALRDKFVCGLANLNLQKRLLTEENLTLEQAISIATAMEMAVLESHESKKTAGASSYMQVEEINRIKSKICGMLLLLWEKGHMASLCCSYAYKYRKCSKAGHLQAVCPEDKNPQGEKQKSEKQRGQRSSNGIQQLQTAKQ